MKDLLGRVALVTGAGGGWGRATARVLAAGGATVVATDIDLRSAEETVELIRKDGGTGEAARLDVADREAIDRVVEDVAHRHNGAFDVLVHSAGTNIGADPVDATVEGSMYLSQAFARHRRGRDQVSDIVCVVPISAIAVGAGPAEAMQTEARARSWPVRVSAINPAATATPEMDPEIVANLVRHAVTLPHEVCLQSAVIALRNGTALG